MPTFLSQVTVDGEPADVRVSYSAGHGAVSLHSIRDIRDGTNIINRLTDDQFTEVVGEALDIEKEGSDDDE